MVEQLIAVMGATGAGKTSFVNLVAGSSLPVGKGLESLTDKVQVVSCDVKGCKVQLIDTPGFDDTYKSDTEILEIIATYLANSYRDGRRLSGVIFLHRITDIRVGGVSYRMIKMLQDLCGDKALASVVICTTMWHSDSPIVLAQRETELKDTFWKPMLNKGAKVDRHDNGKVSATRAISHILSRRGTVNLDIQRQMVDEKKKVGETAAARQAQQDAQAQIKAQEKIKAAQLAHKREIEKQRQAQAQALRAGEERRKKELEALKKRQQVEADTKKREQERQQQLQREQSERQEKEKERLAEMAREAQRQRERQHMEQIEHQRRMQEQGGCTIF